LSSRWISDEVRCYYIAKTESPTSGISHFFSLFSRARHWTIVSLRPWFNAPRSFGILNYFQGRIFNILFICGLPTGIEAFFFEKPDVFIPGNVLGAL